jgi:hypothetical protein
VSGNSYLATTILSGILNMGNNLIQNIGAAGTDFSGTGGLTLADALIVSGGGIDVTGDSTFYDDTAFLGGVDVAGALGITGDTTLIGDFDITGNSTLNGDLTEVQKLETDRISIGGKPLSLISAYPSKGNYVNVSPIPDYVSNGSGTPSIDMGLFNDFGVLDYISDCSETFIRQDGPIYKIGIWVENLSAWSSAYTDSVKITFWRRDRGVTMAWDNSWDLIATSEDIRPAVYAQGLEQQVVYVTLATPVSGTIMADYIGMRVDDAGGTDCASNCNLTEMADDGTNNYGDIYWVLNNTVQEDLGWTTKSTAGTANKCFQVEVMKEAPQVIFADASIMSGMTANEYINHQGWTWGGCAGAPCTGNDLTELNLFPEITPAFMFKNLTGMTVQDLGQSGHSVSEWVTDYPAYIRPLKPRILAMWGFIDDILGTPFASSQLKTLLDYAEVDNTTVLLMEPPPCIVSAGAGCTDDDMQKRDEDWENIKIAVKTSYTNVILGDTHKYLGTSRSLSTNGNGTWTALTAYSTGNVISPDTDNCDGSQYFKAISAGTTAAGEPTWVCGEGNITTDGTVTWENQGKLTDRLWDLRDVTNYADYLSGGSGHLTTTGNSILAEAMVNALNQPLQRDSRDFQGLRKYYFEAVNTTDVTNIVAAAQVIPIDSVRHDPFSWANFQYSFIKPTISGTYLISWGFYLTGRTANDETDIWIQRDNSGELNCSAGTLPLDGRSTSLAKAATSYMSGSTILYLNGATDYIYGCAIGVAANTTDIANGEIKLQRMGD